MSDFELTRSICDCPFCVEDEDLATRITKWLNNQVLEPITSGWDDELRDILEKGIE